MSHWNIYLHNECKQKACKRGSQKQNRTLTKVAKVECNYRRICRLASKQRITRIFDRPVETRTKRFRLPGNSEIVANRSHYAENRRRHVRESEYPLNQRILRHVHRAIWQDPGKRCERDRKPNNNCRQGLHSFQTTDANYFEVVRIVTRLHVSCSPGQNTSYKVYYVWMVHILPTSTPQTHMCIARRRAYCFYFFCACISTSVRRVFEVSLKCFCAGNTRIGVYFVKGCGGTVRIVCIHIPHIDFPISCTLIRINLYINALLEMHFYIIF